MELFLGERELEIQILVRADQISPVANMQKLRFQGHRGHQDGHEGLACPLFLNTKTGQFFSICNI